MVKCPNCLYNNMTGAVFCSECGAQLVRDESQKTGSMRATNGLGNSAPGGAATADAATPYPDAPICLHLLGSSIYLPIINEDEVVLGRATEGQSVSPDINLEPYHAFDAGVSRIHAAIRIVENRVLITDLGSGNGTLVNGKKIEPHIPHPIKHGDLLNLGKFKIQVIIQSQAK